MRLSVAIALALPLVACGSVDEEEISATGTLEVGILDDFEHQRSEKEYYLVQDDQRLRLWLEQEPAQLAGEQVVVTGRRSQREGLEVESMSRPGPQALQPVGPGRSAISSTGNKSLAVILFNFSDDRSEPATRSDIEQWVFTNVSSPTNFKSNMANMSFGQTNYSGVVVGWYTIGYPNSGCSFGSWSAQARMLAGLSGYEEWAYVFPHAPGCSWGGWGDLPGDEVWINLSSGWGEYGFNAVLAHEFGHNFGLDHATSYDCSGGCTTSEYGDSYDIMGSGSIDTHYFSGRATALNWISPSQVQNVTSTGTYRIYPVTSLSSPKGLRVERGVEDLFVDWLWFGGTVMRWSDGGLASKSKQIAPNLNASLYGSTLDGSEKHRDLTYKFSVQVMSETFNYADVRVYFATCGNGVCDTDFGESCASCPLTECCGAQDPCLQNGTYYSYNTGRSNTLYTTNSVDGAFEITMSCSGPYYWALTSGSCPGGWYSYNNGKNVYCSLGSSNAAFRITYGSQNRTVNFY